MGLGREPKMRALQHFELEVLLAMLADGGETYSVPLELKGL